MARGDDIEQRLVTFAANIIKMCEQLPKTYAGRHLAQQILRSGTSPAAQYGEARGAESSRDFVHKLKIGVKELNETKVWLKIIQESEMLNGDVVDNLVDEAIQLGRIFNASIRTARRSIDN